MWDMKAREIRRKGEINIKNGEIEEKKDQFIL